jgi:membrane protease subunit (stomatin/prohibitin family)
LDIIWMRTGRREIKWGLGNVTTQDGINVGANGTVAIRISDGDRFNNEVIQGGMEIDVSDLQQKILPGIQGVMRAKIAELPAMALKTQRDLYHEAITEALGQNLADMGLEVASFELAEINFPAEFEAALSQKTISGIHLETDLLTAQHQAQVTTLKAQAEAHAQLTEGMARTQVMAQMQSQGIDPVKLKAMEALQIMAENPTAPNVQIGGNPERTALFTQLIADSSSNQIPAAKPGLPSPSTTNTHDAASIQAKIDQLTERLVNGEINGETYDRAVEVLQRRLPSS